MSVVETLIFCLTRDRPRTLIRTLGAIAKDLQKAKVRSRAIVVLDDSVAEESRIKNTQLIHRFRKENEANYSWIYHGPVEQAKILDFLRLRCGLSLNKTKRFFRRLGGHSWDLGGVRSYAILLANIEAGPSAVVVMIDDDIVILPPLGDASAIDILERAIRKNPRLLTGARLRGSPDESSVETALRFMSNYAGYKKQIQLSETPMPIAGGLLAFDSSCGYLYPFPRWYNEDWSWLAQLRKRGYRVRVENRVVADHKPAVKQLKLANMKREQEGEFIFEAVNWAIAHYATNCVARALRSLAYWRDVGRHEVLHLSRVVNLASTQDKLMQESERYSWQRKIDSRHILNLLECTKSYVASINPEVMMKRYWSYLENVKLWGLLIKAARNGNRSALISSTRGEQR
jgi:hypothetical protein